MLPNIASIERLTIDSIESMYQDKIQLITKSMQNEAKKGKHSTLIEVNDSDAANALIYYLNYNNYSSDHFNSKTIVIKW